MYHSTVGPIRQSPWDVVTKVRHIDTPPGRFNAALLLAQWAGKDIPILDSSYSGTRPHPTCVGGEIDRDTEYRLTVLSERLFDGYPQLLRCGKHGATG